MLLMSSCILWVRCNGESHRELKTGVQVLGEWKSGGYRQGAGDELYRLRLLRGMCEARGKHAGRDTKSLARPVTFTCDG